MKNKKIDEIYNLIDKAEYEKAKELISKEDINDIEVQKLLALCDVNLENYKNARKILEDIIKFKQDDAICWYYLGCCYDNLEEFSEAKYAYNKVIELRPEYIDAYKSLAISYIKAQDPRNALDTLKKAEKYISEDDYAFYYIAGTAYMALQDFENSIIYIKKAIELNPENVQLQNNIGTAYLTLGNFDEALEAYKKSIQLEPNDSLAYFNIASIYQIKGEHNKACEYFSKAHDLEPEDDNYIVAWAISELKAGKIPEATNHYKYLSASYPQKTTYKYNLACCLQLLGQYEPAISILIQLSIMKPKAVHILKKLAGLYILTGQLRLAKEMYEKIIRQGNTSYEIYYELAMLCFKTDDIDRAEQILKKVCGLKPNFALAHKDLGVIYLSKRLFDYAKSEFEEAYKYAPDNYSVVIECANYYHAVSDFEKADEFYEKAIELNSEDTSALAFCALNKTHLKQIDQALSLIKKALSKSIASAFLFYITGRIYFLAKDYEQAKDYLVKAFEMEKIPDVQNLLGLCYYKLGDFKQAKIIFKNMLEKAPLNVNILLNIAKSCKELEEKEEALHYLNTIVETFSDCEEAHELIREIS
ncbi:tetratricopeptide repeat protein [bacterium]|nr:tetratricopeptide repeat protein [bacterium]